MSTRSISPTEVSDRTPPGEPDRLPAARSTSAASSSAAVARSSIDDHVLELGLGRELGASGLQASRDLRRRVGAAAGQPRPQRLLVRRCDEHRHRLGHRLSDLAGALHLDLEDHGGAGRDPALELGAQRSVAPPRVVRVLDELVGRDAAVELVGARKW